MSVKPILFSAPMVQALQDGTKTVTRRVVKPPALYRIVEGEKGRCIGSWYEDEHGGYCYPTVDDCPYQPGDILYVRETFSTWKCPDGKEIYIYKAADDNKRILQEVGGVTIKWHPSIHMPKEAARIFLRVADVKVAHIQDMTENDAVIDFRFCPDAIKAVGLTPLCKSAWDGTVKKADLGKYGWDADPWVWVIAFRRVEKEKI